MTLRREYIAKYEYRKTPVRISVTCAAELLRELESGMVQLGPLEYVEEVGQSFASLMGIMARIPEAITLLATGRPRDLTKVLIAAILHSEEEMLVVRDNDLRIAENYTLVTTVAQEEGAVILTTKVKF